MEQKKERETAKEGKAEPEESSVSGDETAKEKTETAVEKSRASTQKTQTASPTSSLESDGFQPLQRGGDIEQRVHTIDLVRLSME